MEDYILCYKKENGFWKILLDAYTGKDANEEYFIKAFSMEENK